MHLTLSVLDQRLEGLADKLADRAAAELGIRNDPARLKSAAFVFLCVKTLLDVDDDEAFDCVTEGGGDCGVDALHLSDPENGEFTVTLFQAKYKRDMTGYAAFPANGISALVNAIRLLGNPDARAEGMNVRLLAKAEEIRSLIRDGSLPVFRIVACNNGAKWGSDAQSEIDRFRREIGDAPVTWEHLNHDVLFDLQRSAYKTDVELRLQGPATAEDLHYARVCTGRLPVTEIHSLIKTHGERLLERNIRRYLGLHGNRVNEAVSRALRESPDDFYFYNNGLTLICSDFRMNGIQQVNHTVRVSDVQIVNGGQTCMTVFKTLEELAKEGKPFPETASVLIRLYKLPPEKSHLAANITRATNTQNPVDLQDLAANDDLQVQLEADMAELGYTYKRKRDEGAATAKEISARAVTESVLAVLLCKPHLARSRSLHFGRLYHDIFEGLNGAQAVTAVLLYRAAEARRKRPRDNDPDHTPYSSAFVAMQAGKLFAEDLKLGSLYLLDHRRFREAEKLMAEKGEAYLEQAMRDVSEALTKAYGDVPLSMQRLSSTFRRADLLMYINSRQVPLNLENLNRT